ncbi:unnamed protein product [Rotaria sp. Silwood2]|nr:unnamed protein product [Rotaria sp. Silwood2]
MAHESQKNRTSDFSTASITSDLSVLSRDDVQTLEVPFSLPILDFAYCIDNALPSLLPGHMTHISEIIHQAFGVDIELH